MHMLLPCSVALSFGISGLALAGEVKSFTQSFHVRSDDLCNLPETLIAPTLQISPDGERVAGVMTHGETQAVFVNGKVSTDYEGVVTDSLHFSPDSKHLCYGAKRDGRAIAVVDEVEYPAYEGCAAGFPIFSPDSLHFIFAAVIPDRRMCVVMDGNLGPPFDAIIRKGLTFSADGKHFAYVAKDGRLGSVVLDGVPQPKYQNVDALTFSPDGAHLAYIARTAASWLLIVDGRNVLSANSFILGSLAFDSPTRLHMLNLGEDGEVSRMQVDLLMFVRPGDAAKREKASTTSESKDGTRRPSR